MKPSVIYYIKKGSTLPESKPSSRLNNFQCMQGHRFQTTLPQPKAICTTCRSKAFRKVDESPVREETA